MIATQQVRWQSWVSGYAWRELPSLHEDRRLKGMGSHGKKSCLDKFFDALSNILESNYYMVIHPLAKM